MKPKDKLAAAVLYVERMAPYFTAALAGMVRREWHGLQLANGKVMHAFAATATGILLIDYEAVEQWTVEQIAGALVHELMHFMRDHAGRGASAAADSMLWNISGDEEINDDLEKHWELLCAPVLPSKFGHPNGKMAEEYYAMHKQEQSKKAPPKNGQKGDQQSQAGAGEAGAGEAGQAEQEDVEQDGSAQPQEAGVGQGRCGSAAGHAVPGEPDETENGKPTGRSEIECEVMRKDVAEAVRQYETQHGRGSVPAGLARWAEGFLKPAKIPWAQKLRRLTRAAIAYRPGASDYSYRAPARRQAALDIAFGREAPRLPKLHSPVPRVTVGIDTSGSMGDGEMLRALAECKGVMQALGIPISFLACDADVHGGIKPVKHWRDLAKMLRGGGGTDFTPAFAAVAKQSPKPEVFIYVTDGDGYYSGPDHAPPGVSVIWVLVGAHRRRPDVHFGEMVEVDDGESAQDAT